jgi:hypothetical protein
MVNTIPKKMRCNIVWQRFIDVSEGPVAFIFWVVDGTLTRFIQNVGHFLPHDTVPYETMVIN